MAMEIIEEVEEVEANPQTRIETLLTSTNRPGMDKLLEHMEANHFYAVPCSGDHHLCVEGGLAQHSLNVYETMSKLNAALNDAESIGTDSLIIVSLLHDLGKMGDHGKPNYVPNILKTGQSKAKPFKTNPELINEEHEIRSVIIAERFIELSEEEESAILHHNGLFSKLDSSFGTHNFDKTKLSFLLHTADMWCSRFVESDGKEEE